MSDLEAAAQLACEAFYGNDWQWGMLNEAFRDKWRDVAEASCLALTQPPETTPGASWSSPSLGRAYAEVESVRDALSQPPESGIDEALRRAMEAIEAADCELMGVAI